MHLSVSIHARPGDKVRVVPLRDSVAVALQDRDGTVVDIHLSDSESVAALRAALNEANGAIRKIESDRAWELSEANRNTLNTVDS